MKIKRLPDNKVVKKVVQIDGVVFNDAEKLRELLKTIVASGNNHTFEIPDENLREGLLSLDFVFSTYSGGYASTVTLDKRIIYIIDKLEKIL
jgi:hypothetical protein